MNDRAVASDLPASSRRRWHATSMLLPIAAAGLAVLLPWRAANLMQRWEAINPSAPSQSAEQPLPETGGHGVILPSGVVAHPVLIATLSATGHASPVGDERPADGHMLAEVARRRAELDLREHELQTRETQVAAAEQLAKRQIAELSRMRESMETLLVHETTASESDLNLLVGLYSNMKPIQAAAVLGKLDAPKAATILQRLETRMAGPILAAMDASAALAITEELEQRRAPFRP